MPSYTYELPEQGRLLSLIRENLNKVGKEWKEIADFMLQGHVEYKPLRVNPMRSGSQFVYQRAKVNLPLYFPERIFEHLLNWLDSENWNCSRQLCNLLCPDVQAMTSTNSRFLES